MTALTPDDLARIEELSEKATPGPWAVNIAGELRAPTPYNGIMLARAWANGADGPDAEFIAASRTAVPALVSAVRSLEAQLATAEAERDDALEAVDAANARVVAAHKYGAAVEEARDEAWVRAAEAEAVIAEAKAYQGDWAGFFKILESDPSAVLARVKAEAFDEGADQGVIAEQMMQVLVNPYRTGADQ